MIRMSEPETRSVEATPPGGSASDARLVEDVRQGDHDAFEVLVRRYEGRLMSVLLRFAQDLELARDLAQETFLRVFERLDQFDPARRFGPWLFRIAHNEAYSLFRKRRPEDELPAESAPAPARFRMYPAELSVAVEGALSRLSAEQREAVILKVYEGFKFEEMAEALDCPVSTVKSRLYTALDLLKEALAPMPSRGVQ